jgi:aryl-alcohol dehydrogenase-like predicted oxidoreductase
VRLIPGTDLDVGRLVLGGNVFGWTADEAASFAVLDAFREAGGTMIDTADSYAHWLGAGGGESEAIVGRWLAARGVRDRMLIATKVGKHPAHKGLTPALVRAGIDGSLRRLGTDHVDLYYAHEDDPTTTLPESLGALSALVDEGKVRHLGASNFTAPRLEQALDVAADHGFSPYVALQPLYNLVERAAYEADLREVCERRGLGVLPYYGLARGFLTGKYRRGESSAARGEAASAYRTVWGEAVLDAVLEVAAAHRTTAAAVALAWLASRPTVVAPIASARDVDQLGELLPALTLELDTADLELLETASEPPPA